MDMRLQRGIVMAATKRITRKGSTWIVPSESSGGSYTVNLHESTPTCTCEDCETNRKKCKHIWAAEFTRDREAGVNRHIPLITKEPIRGKRRTYPQVWPAYNRAQMEEKRLFFILLRQLVSPIEEEQLRGRNRVPLRDVTFSALTKVYLTFSARRSHYDITNAGEKGLLERAPHYNTMLRRFATDEMTAILVALVAETARPLASVETHFVVDSTGLSMGQYASWFEHKHVIANDYIMWRKLHFVAGAKTHIIVSAIPTEGTDNDSPIFKPLLESLPRDFQIESLSADKAYANREVMQLVHHLGGIPYIPPKRRARVYESDPPIWQMMYHYYNLNREKFLEQYHKRSNAESVVSMLKAKFGHRLRNKSETGQINEILAKVVCHNICVLIQSMHEFELKPDFWMK